MCVYAYVYIYIYIWAWDFMLWRPRHNSRMQQIMAQPGGAVV